MYISTVNGKATVLVRYSIISSTVSNAIIQFGFVICLLFTVGNLNEVTNTDTGLPMIEVYYLGTNSVAATNAFTVGLFN